MPNAKWDNATVHEKLEMLRADIKEISDHHNALGRDWRSERGAIWAAIEELKRTHQKNGVG